MNSEEMYSYIHKDYFMRQIFGGILYIDQIPQYNVNDTSIYIYNSLESGSKPNALGHWTLLLFEPNSDANGVNEYFNSYGGVPLKEYRRYLTVTSKPYRYNLDRYQGEQLSCGQHVLFYYYHRARGYSMNDILNTYDVNNLFRNDMEVIRFYNKTK